MNFRILLLAASIMFVTNFTVSAQSNRNADELYEQKRYAEAISAYKQNLKSGVEGFESSALNIAEAYRAMDDAKNAVKWYSRVLKTGKEPFESRNFLHYAQVLSFVGKHREARKWYDMFADEANDLFGDRFQTYLEYEYNDTIKLEIFNLNINTPNDEYSATFYGDSIAFVSGAPHRQTQYYEEEISSEKYYDLYHSSLVGNGVYSKPLRFPANINSQLNEGPMLFHNNKLYFTRNVYKDATEITKKERNVRLRIFESTIDNNTVGASVQLPFEGDYSVGHPAISPEGDKLYFASDKPGGFGGSDIYVCNKQGDSWSAPENMGPKINTDGNELFPFAHTNGDFFFSSNAHNGLGGLDIFKINLTGKQSLINLEEPINSAQDDFAFVINPEENKGFFSSNRVGGKGGDDIYGFTSAGVAVNVQVLDLATGAPIPNAKVSISDLYGSFIFKESDLNGETVFQAKGKRSYDIFIQASGYESKTQNLETDQNLSDPTLYTIIWLDRLEGGSVNAPNRSNVDRSRLNQQDQSRLEKYENKKLQTKTQSNLNTSSSSSNKNSSSNSRSSSSTRPPKIVQVEPAQTPPLSQTETRSVGKSKGYDLIDLANSNHNHQYFMCSESTFYQMVNVRDRSYLIWGRDRIGLKATAASATPVEILEANSYPVKRVITINDLFFSSSNASVNDASKKELDKIIMILKKQPALNVSLMGFGKDATGKSLAKKRVANACKYLMQNGIAQSRVFASAIGNDCTTNCSGDPMKNRKVEMSLNASVYGR